MEDAEDSTHKIRQVVNALLRQFFKMLSSFMAFDSEYLLTVSSS